MHKVGEDREYIAIKRVYFYGLRFHIVTGDESFIDEFVIVSGRSHDLHGWADASLKFLRERDEVVTAHKLVMIGG